VEAKWDCEELFKKMAVHGRMEGESTLQGAANLISGARQKKFIQNEETDSVSKTKSVWMSWTNISCLRSYRCSESVTSRLTTTRPVCEIIGPGSVLSLSGTKADSDTK
jgi:hypothetical protein